MTQSDTHDSGYIATDFKDSAAAWGKPNDDPDPLYFPVGILIPA
ncbi:MAG: hypothetical protein QM730_15255 [Anaerolineales bacterium]